MTNEFRITKTGEYRTRDGRKAVVLCTDAPDTTYPVVGYVVINGLTINIQAWTIAGNLYHALDDYSSGAEDTDIISEWVEPDIIEEWHGVWLKKSLSYTGFTPEKIGFTITPYSNAVGVFEDDDISSLAVKFRLTTQPDGKQHLEILEQVNRGCVMENRIINQHLKIQDGYVICDKKQDIFGTVLPKGIFKIRDDLPDGWHVFSGKVHVKDLVGTGFNTEILPPDKEINYSCYIKVDEFKNENTEKSGE